MVSQEAGQNRFHPDAIIHQGVFTIHPDGATRKQELVNIVLSLLHPLSGGKRFRTITYEDARVITSTGQDGFYTTPAEAINLLTDLEQGADGEYKIHVRERSS